MSDDGTPLPPREPWWGNFDFVEGRMRTWDVGPVRLRVFSERHEWRFAWECGGDPLASGLAVSDNLAPEDPTECASQIRFACDPGDRRLEVRPRLGDRPFVTKPEVPLQVPTGGQATLFITTPVWVGLCLQPGAAVSHEFPSYRPPDTWFGRDNVEGELCYASRTWAKLSAENFGYWPHRALTSVVIRNRSSASLVLDRIKLPVPNLTLYVDNEGYLRTSGLMLKKDDEHDLAQARLLERGSAEASWQVVSPPRVELRNRWVDAFSGMFG